MKTPLTVTVIVPMRNEEDRIGRCLDSILANDFPKDDLEVLVADGMSDDNSRSVVQSRAHSFNHLRILDNPAEIVSSGLNIGIQQSEGRVIIILGAHSEYPRHYISTCLRELRTTGADAVGGVLNTQPGADSLVARAIALMTQHPFGVGGSSFRTRSVGHEVDTLPYAAYRRTVFARVGLFNEQLTRNQDFEFNARVRAAGGRLFLSPDLEVVYYNVPTFKRLAVQAFNNGFWLAKMWTTSPVSFRMRHAVPLAFVICLLASILLVPAKNIGAFVLPSILSVYFLAASIAAVQISFRIEKSAFFPLIGLLFTHHFLYGLGTLVGLISLLRPKAVPSHIRAAAASH